MKKSYKVMNAFWRGMLLVDAGTTIELSDAEAKYLGHHLEPVPPAPPEDEPAPAKSKKAASEA
jgi:hypothetical protein